MHLVGDNLATFFCEKNPRNRENGGNRFPFLSKQFDIQNYNFS